MAPAVVLPPLRLPRHFIPTHRTDGLAGHGSPPWGHGRFDAIDCFAKGGAYVCAEITGEVIKISGHAPTPTTKPGGPYGRSVYIETAEGVYFGTHFGTLSRFNVKLGQVIRRGMLIGRVADYAKATGGVTPSHIHWAFTSGVWHP